MQDILNNGTTMECRVVWAFHFLENAPWDFTFYKHTPNTLKKILEALQTLKMT
jgi:hypothetical protein